MRHKTYGNNYIRDNNIDKIYYGFIYITTNEVNKKRYIGKRKFSSGWMNYYGSGLGLKRAIKKYGKSNFSRVIIDFTQDEEDAVKKEEEYIESYGAVESDDFYNLINGAGGNNTLANMSEEQLREWKLMMREVVPNGAMSPMATEIVMVSTVDGSLVKTFGAMVEANNHFGLRKNNRVIHRICKNRKGRAYGYHWLYLDDYRDLNQDKERFKTWFNNQPKSRDLKSAGTKRVYQLDKGDLSLIKKFATITDASKVTGIRSSELLKCCKHTNDVVSVGGYCWIFGDVYEGIMKKDLFTLYEGKRAIKIACLNTGEIFREAWKPEGIYHVDKRKILKCCRGDLKSAGLHPETNEPLVWIYFDFEKHHIEEFPQMLEEHWNKREINHKKVS